MRTDVKVGLVIALVLVVAGLYFFVFRSKGPDVAPEEQPVARQDQERPDQSNRVVFERPRREEPREPSSLSREERTAPRADRTDSSGGEIELGFLPGTERAKVPDEEVADASEPRQPSAEEPSPWWPTDRTPSRLAPSEPQADTRRPAGPTWSSPPLPAGTYRVKKGDTYWDIAKATYGDPTLYKLLERANPNMPATSLAPGMTIKVPARPAKAPAIGSPPVARSGQTESEPLTGKGYYIVKKGDNGFWGISVAVFKTPKRWKEIAALNPKLNPNSLMPGQKVILPEGAAGSSVPRPSGSRSPARVASATVPPDLSGVGAPTRKALADGRVFD